MNASRRILSTLVLAPLAAAVLAACTGMYGQGAETKMMPASVQDGIGEFYWIDRELAYALSGALEREALLPVADAIYRQLVP